MKKERRKWGEINNRLQEIAKQYNQEHPKQPEEDEIIFRKEQRGGTIGYRMYMIVRAVAMKLAGKSD